MKKLSISIICLVVLLAFPFSVSSQEVEVKDFDNSYNQYKSKIEEYNSAHDDYVLARAQYLRFGTQKSKDDAYNATLKMLELRDDVVSSYLVTLKFKLAESEGIDDSKKKDLGVEIDSEISWYSDHKNRLPSAYALEDLVKASDEAKSRFVITQDLGYRVLSYFSHGRLLVLKNRLDSLFSNLNEKVETIEKEERQEYKFSEDKLQIIDKWMVESGNHIESGTVKMSEAVNLVEQPGSKTRRTMINSSGYDMVLSKLQEARLLFRETTVFLKEVMRQIKTAESE